jgi:3-oxoadipate enol-lactonase
MPLLQRSGKPALYYEVDDYTDPWKNAPFMLFQHGYGRSSRFWYPWVPYLSRWYRLVRTDLRGLGRSSRDFDLTTGFTPEAYMEDIDDILEALGAQSVHYCGESTGGILGMIYAATRPRRVRTLNLVSAPLFINEATRSRGNFGHDSGEAMLRKLGSRGYSLAKNTADRFPPGTDPGLMAWFAEEQGKSDVEVMIAMQKFVRSADTRPYLPKIEAPVLCLYPSHDTHTTPDQEDALRNGVRNLNLVHLPSTSHNLHLTQPARCAQHVLHFAAQHDGMPCRE